MIEFKVIATPDKSQQSAYQHAGTQLTIGSLEGDMIIDDPNILGLQIRVRFEGQQAVLENLGPDVEVRLNGRAINGPTPIKERDSVSMGRTTMSFTRLDLSLPTPPPPYEHPHAEMRFAPDTKESAILAALDVLIQQADGARPAGPRTGATPPLPGAARPPLPPPLPKKT
jgi:hypothetical protein